MTTFDSLEEEASDHMATSSHNIGSFGLSNVSKIKLKLPAHNKWRLNKSTYKNLFPSFLFTEQSEKQHIISPMNAASNPEGYDFLQQPSLISRREQEHDPLSGLSIPATSLCRSRSNHSAVSRTASNNTTFHESNSVGPLSVSYMDSDLGSVSYNEPDIPEDVSLHPLGRYTSWSSYTSSIRNDKIIDNWGKSDLDTGNMSINNEKEEFYLMSNSKSNKKDADNDFDIYNNYKSNNYIDYDTPSDDDSSDKETRLDPLLIFPVEVMDHIFTKLDINSLISCACVSKRWKEYTASNSLWRHNFKLQSNWKTIEDIPESVSWKDIYKIRHLLENRWKAGLVNPMALQGHVDSVYCVKFDAEKIVTGSRDRTLKIWDVSTGKLLKTLGCTASLDNISLSSSLSLSSISSTSSSSTSSLLDNAKLVHTGSVLCVTMDESVMISGSSDCSCIIWELPKCKPVKKVFRHVLGVLDIDMNKKYVVSCSKDSTISVWARDSEYSLKHRFTGHRGPINAIQMRGDFIVSAGGDALVKLWSIQENKCIRTFKGHSRGLACVQMSLCQKYIVSGGNDNTIRIWKSDTGECLHQLVGHSSLIRSICISSGRVISGSYDQTIKVWDLETGELITDLTGLHGSWIFSVQANIHRIVSTSFGTKPVILDFSIGLDKKILQYIAA